VAVRNRAPLGGGCITRVERLDTSDGPFVLKSMTHSPPGFFEAEALGLETLRRAASGLVVPAPITASVSRVDREASNSAADEPFLVIEFLPPGRRGTSFDEAAGRGLAALHRRSSARFGFERATFCGTTLQPNDWAPRWIPFYAESRLGHQIGLAAGAGCLDADSRRRLERVVERLDTWLTEPDEGPALIHGDLWSGNLHTTADGRPALLDPAVCFGHRELELGMMQLFGGFPDRVYAAYDEVFPLDAGWRDRQPLYQLYHLLNHLNLFGSGYHEQVMNVCRRFA
jgi:fructosamine-3-kinase